MACRWWALGGGMKRLYVVVGALLAVGVMAVPAGAKSKVDPQSTGAADDGGDDADPLHVTGMADRAQMQRTTGQRLIAVARIGELGQHWPRRWGRRQEPAAPDKLGRPAPVAEQAVVTDAL